MRPLSLYLDTSTISLLFQTDAGERHEVTRAFFENVVKTRRHNVFISDVVMEGDCGDTRSDPPGVDAQNCDRV